MPVLHWRDQEKQDRLLSRKKLKGKAQKYQVDDVNDIDERTEDNNEMNEENRITTSQSSPLKQQRKNPFGTAAPGGYDTVDTTTGPSEDDGEESSDADKTSDDEDDAPEVDEKEQDKTQKQKDLRIETDHDAEDDDDDHENNTKERNIGPESDSDNIEDDLESGYGSSVDYGVDYEVGYNMNENDSRVETEIATESESRNQLNDRTKDKQAIDVIKLWRDQKAEDLADKARRQCSNCDSTMAAWRCHGCEYSYCERCNRDVHAQFCLKYRPKDHVLQRVDGMPLSCGRCKKGVWEIAMHGYDHFQHHYKKKRKEQKRIRMQEEIVTIKEKVADQRSIYKKERKGNRLRQAQQDKLSELYRVEKEAAEKKIKIKLDKIFAPMMKPLHFDPKQLELERGDNGRPIVPPPVDETGRAIAMFSFDFNRNTILCRACNVFWNSGPRLGRRVVVNAYAPVGPIIDPQAAARRTVQRIHDSKIHARLMEKLRLEAEAKARLPKPKKSRMCMIM
mgnify:CR=1 FL=1|tara:strand:- start:445 stop:1962 length:1518 start_codon:yes stop_codon:yes gene_type:complete